MTSPPAAMDVPLDLRSTAHHRRPILLPSSSFHLLGQPLSPPASPVKNAGRRRPTPPPVQATVSHVEPSSPTARLPLNDVSAAEGSNSSNSSSSMSSPIRPPARHQPARRDKGKGREVISPLEALDRALNTMGGRESAMKLLQFIIRTVAFLARLPGCRGASMPGSAPDWRARLDLIHRNLALTRRTFYFASFLNPLLRLSKPPKSLASIVRDTLSLVASVAEDIRTLHRFGFVGRRLGYQAAEWSHRFWLYSIIVNLSHLSLSTPALVKRIAHLEGMEFEDPEGGVREEAALLRRKCRVEVWRALKYWLDLIFVSYDVFHFKPYKYVLQMLTGLCSAAIGLHTSVESQHIDAIEGLC